MRLQIRVPHSGDLKIYEIDTLEDLAEAVDEMSVSSDIFDGIDTEDLEASVKALAAHLVDRNLDTTIE